MGGGDKKCCLPARLLSPPSLLPAASGQDCPGQPAGPARRLGLRLGVRGVGDGGEDGAERGWKRRASLNYNPPSPPGGPEAPFTNRPHPYPRSPSLQGDKRAVLELRVALGLAGFENWGTSVPLSHTLRKPPHPPAPIHPEVKGCITEGRVAAASTVRSGAPGSRGGGAAWAPRGAPPEAA